jgi:hypothetical protein
MPEETMEEKDVQNEIDIKVNAAVVALKGEIDSLLKRITEDNVRLLNENYELSNRLRALDDRLRKLEKGD